MYHWKFIHLIVVFLLKFGAKGSKTSSQPMREVCFPKQVVCLRKNPRTADGKSNCIHESKNPRLILRNWVLGGSFGKFPFWAWNSFRFWNQAVHFHFRGESFRLSPATMKGTHHPIHTPLCCTSRFQRLVRIVEEIDHLDGRTHHPLFPPLKWTTAGKGKPSPCCQSKSDRFR